MPKFERKTPQVEAVQWIGANLREIIDLTGLHPTVVHMPWDEYSTLVEQEGLKIFTPIGPITANGGDWVVKDESGYLFVTSPENFSRAYNPVEDRIKIGTGKLSTADRQIKEPELRPEDGSAYEYACHNCGATEEKQDSFTWWCPDCGTLTFRQLCAYPKVYTPQRVSEAEKKERGV